MTAAKEFYRKHYGGEVAVGATPLDKFADEMLAPSKRYSLVNDYLANHPPKGGCIAEIGCGGGEALLIFSKQYEFNRFVGVGVASLGAREKVEFLTNDLDQKWPFNDGEVDCLVAMMIIEHLYDPFHSFSEIKRVLSLRGIAFVNLPLVTGIRNRFRLLTGQLPITSTGYANWIVKREWDGNHLHYFSIKSIRDLANTCGLRVIEVRGVGRFQVLKNWKPQLLASEVTVALTHSAT